MNWRRFLGAVLTGVVQAGYGIALVGAAELGRLGSVTPSFLIVASTGPGSARAVGPVGPGCSVFRLAARTGWCPGSVALWCGC
jgi:hypothetical protein